MFGALTGSPAAGGTWSPALSGAGTYTYTQTATSPCVVNNNAQVVVTVQSAPASAGSNGTLSLCSTTTLTTGLLFGALTGSPAAGGTWSPALAGAGTYTYTQVATSPCVTNNTATVVVTVQSTPASAGSNGTLSLCSTTTLTTGLLFGALTGSPAAGGTWSPALAGAGTYTYTQVATSPCTVDNTAQVMVSVVTALTWYQDLDGDGYGNSAVSQLTCNNLAPAYSLVGGDCNDAVAAINPGATEICYNNIDDNCDGNKSEGCTAVVVNMTQSYNNSTLFSLSVAVAAVAYSYPGATTLAYRFYITNTATGAFREFTQTSRYATIPAAIHSFNTAYTIKASAVINGEDVAYAGNTITVNSPDIPTVKLSAANCGSVLPTLTSTVSSEAALTPAGASALTYTFRIRLTSDNGPSPTYGEVTTTSRFIGANSMGVALQYGTSYTVTVKYGFLYQGNPYSSAYGAECTITTPSIVTLSLAAPVCGTRLPSMGTTVTSSSGTNAVKYRFHRRLVGGLTYSETLPSTSRFSSMIAMNQGSVALTYATDYLVSVQHSVLVNGVETWSAYGPECLVKTPFAPFSELVTSQCGTEGAAYEVPMRTTQINATAVAGVSYRFILQQFDINSDPTFYAEITRSVNWFTLDMFVPALTAGAEYVVSVVVTDAYGTGYGKDCTIRVPLLAREIATVDVKVPFSAMAYPNPFTNNFVIDVKTRSESAVSLKVYDMIGRLVDQREVKVSDLGTSPIGDNYPSGVYNVIVTQGDEVRTVRVVKR